MQGRYLINTEIDIWKVANYIIQYLQRIKYYMITIKKISLIRNH